ncbi:MAG: hypothetical protein ABF289_18355 [Clostridiales bacterium]
MNQNKLDFLDVVIKRERIYQIKIYGKYLMIKNSNGKLLKPYYVFNTDKKYYTKRFMLYCKGLRFEYSEYELYAYSKGFDVLGKRFYKNIYERSE